MLKLEIDHQHYLDVLNVLSSISLGEVSPVYLEEQVRQLSGPLPLLSTMFSWLGVAISRTHEAKEGDIEHNRGDLQTFLVHDEMMCRAQGAVAALVCVAEVLNAMSKEEVQVSSETDESGRETDADSTD